MVPRISVRKVNEPEEVFVLERIMSPDLTVK